MLLRRGCATSRPNLSFTAIQHDNGRSPALPKKHLFNETLLPENRHRAQNPGKDAVFYRTRLSPVNNPMQKTLNNQRFSTVSNCSVTESIPAMPSIDFNNPLSR